MITGTIYGVALNDEKERAEMADAFNETPYKLPPNAPVLYVKPHNCVTLNAGRVVIDADIAQLIAAPTLALLFEGAPNTPTGIALAIDLFEAHDSVYRPAIRQQCRDGFLPFGASCEWTPDILGKTFSFGLDAQPPLTFDLKQLVRAPAQLVKDISGFMTLCDADALLVGLPLKVNVPKGTLRLAVAGPGMPGLTVELDWEQSQ